MVQKQIKGLNLQEITRICEMNNFPPFRAKQLYHWMYRHGINEANEMNNIPKEMSELLSQEYQFKTLQVEEIQSSEKENTKKILRDKYDQYKNDWAINGVGTMLTYPQWIRKADGGAGILRSRYELSKMYEAQSSEVKDDMTFEQWIDANSRNPLLVGSNGLLTKNKVTISDVSITKSTQEGIKEDKLEANEKVVKKDTIAFGCTSAGQAQRLGHWVLKTDTLETELLSFSTSIGGGFLRPGDIINVQDRKLDSIDFGGRLTTGSTTTSIKLDRGVELQTGQSYDCLLYTSPSPRDS